jgi:hypothetical protein
MEPGELIDDIATGKLRSVKAIGLALHATAEGLICRVTASGLILLTN